MLHSSVHLLWLATEAQMERKLSYIAVNLLAMSLSASGISSPPPTFISSSFFSCSADRNNYFEHFCVLTVEYLFPRNNVLPTVFPGMINGIALLCKVDNAFFSASEILFCKHWTCSEALTPSVKI